MEVALEPAALGHAGLEDAHARRVELRARLGALERERDELREAGEPVLGVGAERAATAATSTSPQVRPPATTGAATAER